MIAVKLYMRQAEKSYNWRVISLETDAGMSFVAPPQAKAKFESRSDIVFVKPFVIDRQTLIKYSSRVQLIDRLALAPARSTLFSRSAFLAFDVGH